MDDLKNSALPLRFVPSMVSTESIDQMIRAHQLKYIENVIEVEEEYKFNLMKFMEDSECLVDEEGKPIVTWKANKRGSRTFLMKGF